MCYPFIEHKIEPRMKWGCHTDFRYVSPPSSTVEYGFDWPHCDMTWQRLQGGAPHSLGWDYKAGICLIRVGSHALFSWYLWDGREPMNCFVIPFPVLTGSYWLGCVYCLFLFFMGGGGGRMFFFFPSQCRVIFPEMFSFCFSVSSIFLFYPHCLFLLFIVNCKTFKKPWT